MYPIPLRKPHPTDTAKWCPGATRNILVVALTGHNTNICTLVDTMTTALHYHLNKRTVQRAECRLIADTVHYTLQ